MTEMMLVVTGDHVSRGIGLVPFSQGWTVSSAYRLTGTQDIKQSDESQTNIVGTRLSDDADDAILD